MLYLKKIAPILFISVMLFMVVLLYITSQPKTIKETQVQTQSIPSIPKPERLSLDPSQIQKHLDIYYKNSEPEILEWITAILKGENLPSAPLSNEDILLNRIPSEEVIGLGGGRNLLEDALAFDRMDAVIVFLVRGLEPNSQNNIILWSILEQWTPSTNTIHQEALEVYARQGGDVDISHPDGYGSLEIASTVSDVAVAQMISHGANPWISASGFGSSLMERLTLHSDIPFVLDMVETISNIETLQKPEIRAFENTIGNLVDRFDTLAEEGRPIGFDENGNLSDNIDSNVQQIARIVMNLTKFENTPWQYVPQEFVDLQNGNKLKAIK